ncbi:MAG: hypothetical protein CMJ60_07010, partial [Planctomycetaceae bacterium]|nr:hypothetical protein [Planctomycetaceae bacterium]
ITQVEVTNPGIVSIGRLDSYDLNISQWLKRFFKAVPGWTYPGLFPACPDTLSTRGKDLGRYRREIPSRQTFNPQCRVTYRKPLSL